MTDRQLINLAEQASRNAYVPYSHFAVGGFSPTKYNIFHSITDWKINNA